MHPAVSIVIPTRNNKNEKCFSIYYVLVALLGQTNAEAEIIIVDDCGTDATIDSLLSTFPEIRVVRSDEPVSNRGKLRNMGASVATGDIVLFVDDDTLLPAHDTVTRVSRLARDYDFGCGAHRYWTSVNWYRFLRPEQSVSSMVRTASDISFLPKGIMRENGFRDLNEFSFIGNCGFVRKQLFDEIGRFDENFLGWGFEDVDLIMRLCLARTRHVLLNEDGLNVIHLTHIAALRADYTRNMQRFNELEHERGYHFHINHFFGVYEADGHALFTPVTA